MDITEIEKAKKAIDAMSRLQMASLWRFAPIGHPYFDSTNGDLSQYFQERFKNLGGFTPEISKALKEPYHMSDIESRFSRDELTEACEQIDAAMFSGDAFDDPINRDALREYMGRWEREMTVIQNNEPLISSLDFGDDDHTYGSRTDQN